MEITAELFFDFSSCRHQNGTEQKGEICFAIMDMKMQLTQNSVGHAGKP
jgi:hypothetical protein